MEKYIGGTIACFGVALIVLLVSVSSSIASFFPVLFLFNGENIDRTEKIITDYENEIIKDLEEEKEKFMLDMSEKKVVILEKKDQQDKILVDINNLKKKIYNLKKDYEKNKNKISKLKNMIILKRNLMLEIQGELELLEESYYEYFEFSVGINIDVQFLFAINSLMDIREENKNEDINIKALVNSYKNKLTLNEELTKDVLKTLVGELRFEDTKILDYNKEVTIFNEKQGLDLIINKELKEVQKNYKVNIYTKDFSVIYSKYNLTEDEIKILNSYFLIDFENFEERYEFDRSLDLKKLIKICNDLLKDSKLRYLHGGILKEEKKEYKEEKNNLLNFDNLYTLYEREHTILALEIIQKEQNMIRIKKTSHYSSGRIQENYGFDSYGFYKYLFEKLKLNTFETLGELYLNTVNVSKEDLKLGDFGFYNSPLKTKNDTLLFGIFSGEYEDLKKEVPLFYYIDSFPIKEYDEKKEIDKKNILETNIFKKDVGDFRYYRRYFNIKGEN